ncbi:MAG TPA: response regulator, partial [candidate division Zixibacteria bacterium]|nr:response regulator [candidate division Zixibacteria bacterium]
MDHSAEDLSQTQPLGLESGAVRSGRIVIVDDEVALGRMICDYLNEIEGLEAIVFDNAEDTTAYLRANTVDMLLTDLCIGEQSGVDMLDVALDANPDTMVILMTAYPTAKTAISVLQKGGYDYLVKPFKLERLRAVVFRGLEAQRMRRENIRLREELGLLKVSSALLSDLNVEETLNMVLEAALRDMGARGVGFAFDSGNPRIDGIEARVMEDSDQEALFFLTDSRSAIFGSHPSQRGPVKQRGSSAAGHRTYIGFPLRSGEKFFGSLNAYFNRECHDAELRMLELLSSSASAAISRAMLHERLSDSYMQALKALAGAIEARDRYTAGHTDRVSQMSELIARDLGWSDAQIL